MPPSGVAPAMLIMCSFKRSNQTVQMQAFAYKSFHDGIVRAVVQPVGDRILYWILMFTNPGGVEASSRIKFLGVREIEGISNSTAIIGFTRKCTCSTAGFEYQVLFSRSDFRVVADDVELEHLHSKSSA